MAERGKDGHFGPPGMRERAARIGATFSVTSVQGDGTAILAKCLGGTGGASGPSLGGRRKGV